jgi:reverse gyrase
MAFRHISLGVVGIECDRAVGVAKYFGIVVGFRISRPEGIFYAVRVGVPRQRLAAIRIKLERPFEQAVSRIGFFLRKRRPQ